jgi:hypothetical protein
VIEGRDRHAVFLGSTDAKKREYDAHSLGHCSDVSGREVERGYAHVPHRSGTRAHAGEIKDLATGQVGANRARVMDEFAAYRCSGERDSDD